MGRSALQCRGLTRRTVAAAAGSGHRAPGAAWRTAPGSSWAAGFPQSSRFACRSRRMVPAVWLVAVGLTVAAGPFSDAAETTAAPPSAADRSLAAYFRRETVKIEQACLAGIDTIDDWQQSVGRFRRELFEMFGLPAAGVGTASADELRAVVTGRLQVDAGDEPGDPAAGFTVEKLHFQSRPGLYVTANLYLPSTASPENRCPAVLYLCGHGRVVEDGVSLGNKTHYQHHGAWLAEHGYAVLILDTLQLGEIEGIHHGTFREGRWWWASRGYTPAGVEALNGIRGIDYLLTRPEIDPERIGVTGRSGGGAGSWWAVALDERVKAAVPVAGITDLRDHVVNGCISGHCDCMFVVNTYRWDYPQLAALAFPRPLLLANTDRDRIFPLGGVMRTQARVRRLYELGDRPQAFGLVMTPGGHADTQDLQMPAIRWLDAHLGIGPRLIDNAARKRFRPRELKVFADLPADERNTRIDREFVPLAGPFAPPASPEVWRQQAAGWKAALLEKTFRGWPREVGPPVGRLVATREGSGLVEKTYRFESQPGVELDLVILHRQGIEKPTEVVLEPVDQPGWERLAAARQTLFGGQAAAFDETAAAAAAAAEQLQKRLEDRPVAVAWLAPRGVGPTRWRQDAAVHTHNRRRFLLLGQTWEGMQAYDIRRAMQLIRRSSADWFGGRERPLTVNATGGMAVLTVYASLFEDPPARLELSRVPVSHDAAPVAAARPVAPPLLNVLQILDVPQAVALAADRGPVTITDTAAAACQYAREAAAALGWPEGRLDTAAAAAPATATAVSFAEQTLDPRAGKICYAVTLADVDGDGRDDVVVVTEEAVIWYANPGASGGAWSKRDLIRGQTLRDNVCIAAHDIDGDGLVDFALGAGWPRGGTLAWLGRGGDPIEPWQVHDIGPLAAAHRMHWADVLGAGRPQVVVSPLKAAVGAAGVPLTAFAIPDNPAVDRWLPTVLETSLNRLHGHLHTDLDGDGRIDTLTASREGVSLITARPAGGFQRKLISRGADAEQPDAGGAGEIARGRLAAGGDFLVAVEPMHGSDLAVLIRGGTGQAEWLRGVIDSGYARGHAIATADFDGDGGDEIVFGSSDPADKPGYGPTLAVYRRTVAPSPLTPAGWQRSVLDAGGTAVEAVAVGDLSGDGIPDIVAVGRATHNVKLFITSRTTSTAGR